jgi:signal transduction histidine kinase
MKLSAHYSKAIIIITVFVLLGGGVIYFFTINHLGRNLLDRDLTEEFDEVVEYVNLNNKLPKQGDFEDDQRVFTKTNQTRIPLRFFDTVFGKSGAEKPEAGRAVWGLVSVKGERYKVLITESRQSTEDLIQLIGLITVILLVSLLLILFATNRYILNGLWKPFYQTLNKLKNFNISDKEGLLLAHDKVDEFNELNLAVQTMSSRIKNDYQHLQQFTENASHEMLTPLAVITAKLDTLIQDETLSAEQLEQINEIYSSANKLSKLNQSLLLLVKIENDLIEGADFLNLDGLIGQKIVQFHELLTARNIRLTDNIDNVIIMASKYLVDILLNNLFSNAVAHNIDGGQIIITLADNRLIFQNSGSEQPLDASRLFARFQKGKKSEGMGLGLTIVKNICTLYKWHIEYSYRNSLHTFEISF